MSLRVGVIGTSFGARIHVPALREAGFEVVALVGTDPDKTLRRIERLGIPHACTSLAQALELDLQAVSIATPPATHAPLAAEAIEAGCHVLCEKPFTLNAAEAEELVRRSGGAGAGGSGGVDGGGGVGMGAGAGAGVVGMVGHEFRWSLAQSTVAWGLAQGVIGTPRMAVSASFISMLRGFAMPEWWSDPLLGGGWLRASGSHRIDALRQWFGEVEGVSAGLPRLREGSGGVGSGVGSGVGRGGAGEGRREVGGGGRGGVDDSFNIRCTMRNGTDVALIQSGAAAGPGASMTRVLGTTGTMWAEGDTVYVADDASPGGRILQPPPELALPNVDALATGPLAAMTRTELPPYIRLAQAFRAAIEGAPPAAGPQPATFADGLDCMRVLDAIRHSAADGGRWTAVAAGVGDGDGVGADNEKRAARDEGEGGAP
jgi:predicted dehydrogenase